MLLSCYTIQEEKNGQAGKKEGHRENPAQKENRGRIAVTVKIRTDESAESAATREKKPWKCT